MAPAKATKRMSAESLRLVALGLFVVLPLAHSSDQPAGERKGEASPAIEAYLTKVKPLLQERCYTCHGALAQRGGLRLDTAQSIRKGGESGAAVSIGKVEESLILSRVQATDETRMPPEHEGQALSQAEVGHLKDWIHRGAPGPEDEKPEADPKEHWAFRPIARPPVPQPRNRDWARNPIDAFVAEKYEQVGLQPMPEASRLSLLRRVSLDLIGLPPAPEEIARVESDPAPDWYDRAVERLLNDPRHGERWARHWMDIWRYSDWWGLGDQLRNSQKHIWHWRDWIIESLNADLGYDEMIRQSLAADEIYPSDLSKLRATGYLARNFFLFNRHQWMDEVVEHVSKGMLGLTMNCSKCHNHKYDPISQTDYYRFRAIFEPYHVRLDMVPGEVDLNRDGIPRAFDGKLDAPTYRFIRGEESQPDKSKLMEPGVPGIVAHQPLTIRAIDLPADSWQPERRSWVIEAHRAAAVKKLQVAKAKASTARTQLAKAEKKAAEAAKKPEAEPPAKLPATPPGIVSDHFASFDMQRWQPIGGDWSHEPGKLAQKKDGATRSALRWKGEAPRDFDATLRFTILGGSQWRSVGISFDSIAGPNPEAPAAEQSVYVSAHGPGPKIQASYHAAGKAVYPAEGKVDLPIELNRSYTLRLQVRNQLINASLDGEHVLAWQTPIERKPGSLLLTTFDALAVLHEFSIAPLPADASLVDPGNKGANAQIAKSPADLAKQAKADLQVAELAVKAAEAELQSLERRAAVLAQAGPAPSDSSADAAEARKSASRAEREAATAKAELTLAQAEQKRQSAPPAKRDAAQKELVAARAALKKAREKLNEASDQFSHPAGARWTPTRFANSGADDPEVKFPATSTGRRKALAEWITDPRNPLTARVAINHIWARHFGAPLVPTLFDFGRKGRAPTHPELLDWLASELIDSGWSMKHIHRLIVQSAAYRLSASTKELGNNLAKDPDNQFLWRRSTSRLESQAVRDAVLSIAGTLDQTQGGPPVPAGNQAESSRRSLYFYHSNNDQNRFLSMFDEAAVRECYRRDQSIVPQQALALSNSRLILESTRPIAARLSQSLAASERNPGDDSAFIRLAYRVLLGLDASQPEIDTCRAAMESWRALPEAGQEDHAQEFARAQLIWVLLNHNDFVTIR